MLGFCTTVRVPETIDDWFGAPSIGSRDPRVPVADLGRWCRAVTCSSARSGDSVTNGSAPAPEGDPTSRQVSGYGPDGTPILSVIAKRTYTLNLNGRLTMAPKQLPIVAEPALDDDETELLEDSDLYPWSRSATSSSAVTPTVIGPHTSTRSASAWVRAGRSSRCAGPVDASGSRTAGSSSPPSNPLTKSPSRTETRLVAVTRLRRPRTAPTLTSWRNTCRAWISIQTRQTSDVP